MQVTAIERQQRRPRANIFLDGRFALSLSLEVVAEAGLHVGDTVSEADLERLVQLGARYSAYAAALRLLSYRPRSQAEVQQRLRRRGVPPSLVEATVERLRRQGLLDDAAFAHFWVDVRNRTSPRGRKLLWQELFFKGVDRQTAQAALQEVEEEDAAYRAARRRLRALAGLDYATFRRRLGDFLLRRGFRYDVARRTVERLWREAQGDGT
ncbi:MAG: regulatory protein RecX [Dehalococcoidia bacterium]